MHWIKILLLGLLLSSGAVAQNSYSSAELDTLVGPIALYPDPLLSNIMAGAAFPDQIAQANALVKAGTSSDASSGLEGSVQALMTFPEVLGMMDDNKDWTQSIGWASANQITDLVDAIQRFRFQAKSAGNLKTDDKIQVIEEGATIRIEPANPQVIYVPVYQPDVVTEQQSDGVDFGDVLTYSAGIAANVLLWENVFNWGDYHWYYHPGGFYPPAAYYRPYGWRGTGIYNPANVWRPNHTTIVNRPINVDTRNVNVNRNLSNQNWNRNVNNQSWNRNVNRNTAIQANSRPNISQPYSRPPLPSTQPAYPNRQNWNQTRNTSFERSQAGDRSFENRSFNHQGSMSSGWSNYSSSASTMRASSRGSFSRGGGRMGGGFRR